MLVDSHCHIYNQYYNNIELIVENCAKSNVRYIINNACDFKSCLEVLKLCKLYKNMYCVLGIHPTESYENFDKLEDLIRNNLENCKMIGIGEIGLDYYYDKDNRDMQIELFRKQLELAEKYCLPVIVHSRDATNDTLTILKQYNLRGIIHCFNGSLEVAKQYIDMGYKLGINGVVTFNNCKLINVIEELGIDNIVFETDSPYLTPVPFRGKKNDPSYINYIVDFVSSFLNISRDIIIKKSYESIMEIFGRL